MQFRYADVMRTTLLQTTVFSTAATCCINQPERQLFKHGNNNDGTEFRVVRCDYATNSEMRTTGNKYTKQIEIYTRVTVDLNNKKLRVPTPTGEN